MRTHLIMALGLQGILFISPVAAQQPDYSTTVAAPNVAQKSMGSLELGHACQTKLTGFISANTIANKVDFVASKSPESVSIRVDRAAGRFYLTTATAVANGIMDSSFFNIIRETDRYIIALDPSSPGVETVMFDKTNYTFVWTKAVEGLGLSASAMYLECR